MKPIQRTRQLAQTKDIRRASKQMSYSHNVRIEITKTIKAGIVAITLATSFTLAMMLPQTSYASTGSFYQGNNKYKGFYWFETQQLQKHKNSNEGKESFKYPTPEEAGMAIEERKKQLDDARNIMSELSFRNDVPPEVLRDAIVKYKKLEVKMYDSAINLVYASEMANFTNPELSNLNEIPTNVFANKIKRKEEQKERTNIIKQFANEFDLLLFTSSTCPYSKAFLPVATNFASTHGFTLDTAPLDSSEGKIAQSLGIKVTPTLVAISKDSKELFEISSSMSSISELERIIVLSSKYSKELKAKNKNISSRDNIQNYQSNQAKQRNQSNQTNHNYYNKTRGKTL